MARPDLTATKGHGTPDWGFQRAVTQVFPSLDLAELAVRLGSPASFYRDGTVLFYDTFDEGFTHATLFSGTGAADPVLKVGPSKHSGYSALLDPGVAANGDSGVRYFLALPQFSRSAVEAVFSLTSTTTKVNLRLIFYTGAKLLDANVEWDRSTSTLSYYDADNVLTTIATDLSYRAHSGTFAHLKAVIDPTTEKWVRLRLNDRTFLTAAPALRSVASATDPHLDTWFKAMSLGAGSGDAYLDTFIFTINEP